MSVRERNIKWLLESVTYISYNRNSNLYFTIGTVVHCKKYHLHNCNRDSQCVNELCYILITHYINFLIFIYFTNQITLKQSLTRRLKLIFKFSSIKRHSLGPIKLKKGCIKDDSVMCCTITLKFWDEFNASFVLLYFLSYKSIKIWHLYLKNV